mmetsp:Transcript_996/g.1491  ORF Transcript_996/g.1491 Transcript_996/m.1491 type:complete len:127 (-) Transcript_996:439-819(-)
MSSICDKDWNLTKNTMMMKHVVNIRAVAINTHTHALNEDIRCVEYRLNVISRQIKSIAEAFLVIKNNIDILAVHKWHKIIKISSFYSNIASLFNSLGLGLLGQFDNVVKTTLSTFHNILFSKISDN